MMEKCPRCGCDSLTSNGGEEPVETNRGWTHVVKGIAHCNPLDVVMGSVTLAKRAANPLKLTCDRCHHSFKP